MQLDPAAREVLIHYSWPGNVRELQNVLERATAFCEEQCVRVKDLRFSSLSPTQFKNNQSPNDLAGITLQQLEQKAIMDTLQACEGNKAKAAQMLGISTKSIYNKLKRMG